jgi:small-conductance mechanosensitive channel
MSTGDRIGLTIVICLVAIGLGLLLRQRLVERLKKTILDNWLIQTFGAIVVLLPLIAAAIVSPFVLNSTLLTDILDSLRKNQLKNLNPTALVANIVLTVLIIALSLGVARTIMKLVIRGLGENRIDINLRTLIGRMLFILIVIIAFFWVLSIWQIGIDLPVAVLGTLTVAITFAIQDILKDLVAGFYILMERPFHIGDLITISNANNAPQHTGVVEDVQIRTTRIRITSGEQVAVPNMLVFGGVVINNSFYVQRRATITMTLLNEAFDKDETPAKIIKTLQESEKVMVKPEPEVLIRGYADKHVTLKVHFWVESGSVNSVSEVMYTLHTAFPDVDLAVVESTVDM